MGFLKLVDGTEANINKFPVKSAEVVANLVPSKPVKTPRKRGTKQPPAEATPAQIARIESILSAQLVPGCGLSIREIFAYADELNCREDWTEAEGKLTGQHMNDMIGLGLMIRSDFWPEHSTFGQVADVNRLLGMVPALEEFRAVLHMWFSFAVRPGQCSGAGAQVIAFPVGKI